MGLERGLGAVLGKDVVKEILPAFGPDWGLCVTAPTPESKHWAPRMLFAVKVAAGEGSDPIDEALLMGVHTLTQMAILSHNKQSSGQMITLRTTVLDKVKVRYLQGEGTFPPGIRPAFALKSGYLLLASAPEEVQRFKINPSAPGETTPLVRISLKNLRGYLDEHREPLTAALARRDGITLESRERRSTASAAAWSCSTGSNWRGRPLPGRWR